MKTGSAATMLKTHTLPDTAPPTTQEIAQAIASLEARSASHADEAAQTVTVSEVIQHLGLDMTPEDVLAEVQAQRVRPMQMHAPWSAKRKRLVAVLAIGAFAVFGNVWAHFTPSFDASASSAPGVSYVPSPAPQHFSLSPGTLVLDTTGHATVLKTLAEVPDNHPVRCGITPIGLITTSNTPWTVVKHGSKAYLRCWTIPMSAGAMRQISGDMGIILFAHRNGDVGGIRATAPLTLALNNIVVQESDPREGHFNITVSNVSLDSHAHEKWNP